MSKKIVPPETHEPETLDLTAMSIDIADPQTPLGDGKVITIDGRALGAVLRFAAMECPNLEYFTDPDSVALELVGLAETTRACAESDLESLPIDCREVFYSLSKRIRTLAHRLQAGAEFSTTKTKDRVTITRTKAVA